MSVSSAKDKSDTAVQGTNDSSVVSKCSMAAQGYFKDDFLKLFVSSPRCRRAPLINRGYYIRARIIDDILKAFLKQYKNGEKQIISLGAGFDSAFFRLEASGNLDKAKFVEVDFPRVAERKMALIRANLELMKCVGDNCHYACGSTAGCEPSQAISSGVWMTSEKYYLLGADLSDLERLHQELVHCNINTNVPTLVLSECVITYMEVTSSNHLIHWALKTFEKSILVSYEQVQPDDPFGIVMQNHFNKLKSPIKAIQTYPSLDAHQQRYTSMGWPWCHAVNMNQYYYGALSAQEHSRIEALELFDEYEEWHLKCSHYMVVCASSRKNEECLAKLFEFQDETISNEPGTTPCEESTVQLKPGYKSRSSLFKCFAHASTMVTTDTVLLCGGFGETSDGRHSRLNSVRLLDLAHGTLTVVLPQQGSNVFDSRVQHTINAISNSKCVIFGGRTSPAKPSNDTIIITLESQEDGLRYQCETVKSPGLIPTPRWRHRAVFDNNSGRNRLLVYGGCMTGGCALGDFWAMDIHSGIWEKIQLRGDLPEPRHSHTMSSWQEHKVIIAGGLTSDIRPLNSVYTVEVDSWECKPFHLLPSVLPPRYSHTAHVSGEYLILLGGVNPLSSVPPPLVVIHLLETTWKQYIMPMADPELPVMLHNHSSVLVSDNKILILGGGGNCFSFGTHLNKSPVELTFNLPR